MPAFENKEIERDALYWEHEGNAAVREGDYKLVRQGCNGPWQLYDMKADRCELHDLSEKVPDKAKGLAGKWLTWAKHCNVVDEDGKLPKKNKN